MVDAVLSALLLYIVSLPAAGMVSRKSICTSVELMHECYCDRRTISYLLPVTALALRTEMA
jgi:hypothetical protein